MPGLQMSGLASGMDTNAIIAQLMTMERRPRARIELKQSAVQARQDALRDITAKLKALKFAAADLKGAGLWTPQQAATSSDPAKVGARLTGGSAPASSFDVRVTRLATHEAQRWTTRTDTAAQDLSITQGGTTYTVSIAPNSTTDQIVSAINADSSLPVTARNYNGQLLVESKATGTGNAFTLSGAVLDTRQATTAAVNTAFTVNGLAYTSTNYADTTAIPGVELSLNQLTPAGTSVRVTVGEAAASADEVVKKTKAFVDAYNAVVDATRSKLTEKRVPDATTATDARKGVLYGDSGLNNMLHDLRMAAMTPHAVGNAASLDELAEIGISTGAPTGTTLVKDNVNGKLTFDETKFRKALTDDPAAVERLLKDAGQRLDATVSPLTDAGGLLDGRISAATTELSRLKDSLLRMDERLERKETLLRRQFTALETALARSQQQQTDLSSRLPGLSND